MKKIIITGATSMIGAALAAECVKKEIEICPELKEFGYYAVAPVINNGDSIGCVIILSTESPMLEQEEKLAKILFGE